MGQWQALLVPHLKVVYTVVTLISEQPSSSLTLTVYQTQNVSLMNGTTLIVTALAIGSVVTPCHLISVKLRWLSALLSLLQSSMISTNPLVNTKIRPGHCLKEPCAKSKLMLHSMLVVYFSMMFREVLELKIKIQQSALVRRSLSMVKLEKFSSTMQQNQAVLDSPFHSPVHQLLQDQSLGPFLLLLQQRCSERSKDCNS